MFDQVVELRRECWQLSAPGLELSGDGHDAHAYHFCVLDGGRVVAAARLCKHELLSDLPDPHVYHLWTHPFAGPYGCCSRLVVHPQYRNRGIAAMLDEVRADAARMLGCKALVAIWNVHSGIKRRKAVEARGFTNVSNGQAVEEGEWGDSFPFARNLGDNNTVAAQAQGDILNAFSNELNKRLRLIEAG